MLADQRVSEFGTFNDLACGEKRVPLLEVRGHYPLRSLVHALTCIQVPAQKRLKARISRGVGSTRRDQHEPGGGAAGESVNADCSGTATITPKGRSEMHLSLVVADCGNDMLAIETDADTVVSGTLVRHNDEMGEGRSTNESATGGDADST